MMGTSQLSLLITLATCSRWHVRVGSRLSGGSRLEKPTAISSWWRVGI